MHVLSESPWQETKKRERRRKVKGGKKEEEKASKDRSSLAKLNHHHQLHMLFRLGQRKEKEIAYVSSYFKDDLC